MNAANLSLASSLVSSAYIQQGQQALAARSKLVTSLLSQRRMPVHGWDDATIEMLLQDIASMDSNNFLDNVGVGEREARVACSLVAKRHYRLAHGMGRSGDVAAEQPKAAGSSLLVKLTNILTKHALLMAGMLEVEAVTVLPVATGMAVTLTLLAMKAARPKTAHYVLWPRIDQQTCLKAVVSAGLEPIVIQNLLLGDQLSTDMEAIVAQVEKLGAANIVCVVSTTSCFAPRGADKVVEIAKLCSNAGIGHIINNAYGVQSAALCKLITSASRKGRVDAVVQSTDKNFMVPVGGAVIAAGPNSSLVEAVNKNYPGRASLSPLLDLLMTLLHWGQQGWERVLHDREELFTYAKQQLDQVAAELGEKVLNTPANPISLAVTLTRLHPARENCVEQVGAKHVSFFGSMLFKRSVSGTRVVARGITKQVAGIDFEGFGAHCNAYPHDYLTVAAAVGTSQEEILTFVAKLRQCYSDLQRHHS
ncbi:hypothetical protein ABBQ32_013593 [Trebouxia sp. C0010 RCD-2024]